VTAAELASNGSNEAIQANIIYAPFRRRLLRMAPWNCAFQHLHDELHLLVPGTPENTSPGTSLWLKGQPAPPWAYEYQYPIDCLRLCWLTPQTATGFASGIPITTARDRWLAELLARAAGQVQHRGRLWNTIAISRPSAARR